ncbi:hypothetical protein H8959_019542 [Pygathrix nigripes]
MSTAPFSEAPCLSPVLELQLHNGKAVVDLISLCPLLSDTVPGTWWMLPGGFWNEQMSGALLPLPSPTWGFPSHLGSSGTVTNAGDYPVAHISRPCSPDSHSKRMRHSRKTQPCLLSAPATPGAYVSWGDWGSLSEECSSLSAMGQDSFTMATPRGKSVQADKGS